MRFPAKITSSCIWVAIPVDWVILHWYTCGADGRSLGRAVYGHVITKFSRMGRLLHFLTHGAPLARFARESSAITKETIQPNKKAPMVPLFLLWWRYLQKDPNRRDCRHGCLSYLMCSTNNEKKTLLYHLPKILLLNPTSKSPETQYSTYIMYCQNTEKLAWCITVTVWLL